MYVCVFAFSHSISVTIYATMYCYSLCFVYPICYVYPISTSSTMAVSHSVPGTHTSPVRSNRYATLYVKTAAWRHDGVFY